LSTRGYKKFGPTEVSTGCRSFSGVVSKLKKKTIAKMYIVK